MRKCQRTTSWLCILIHPGIYSSRQLHNLDMTVVSGKTRYKHIYVYGSNVYRLILQKKLIGQGKCGIVNLWIDVCRTGAILPVSHFFCRIDFAQRTSLFHIYLFSARPVSERKRLHQKEELRKKINTDGRQRASNQPDYRDCTEVHNNNDTKNLNTKLRCIRWKVNFVK